MSYSSHREMRRTRSVETRRSSVGDRRQGSAPKGEKLRQQLQQLLAPKHILTKRIPTATVAAVVTVTVTTTAIATTITQMLPRVGGRRMNRSRRMASAPTASRTPLAPLVAILLSPPPLLLLLLLEVMGIWPLTMLLVSWRHAPPARGEVAPITH
jgi:hypothetical protein